MCFERVSCWTQASSSNLSQCSSQVSHKKISNFPLVSKHVLSHNQMLLSTKYFSCVHHNPNTRWDNLPKLKLSVRTGKKRDFIDSEHCCLCEKGCTSECFTNFWDFHHITTISMFRREQSYLLCIHKAFRNRIERHCKRYDFFESVWQRRFALDASNEPPLSTPRLNKIFNE